MSTVTKKTMVFAIVIMALLAIPAFAATTGTLTLSGSVPAILEISVTATPGNLSLPITTTVSEQQVATVVERSNKKAGYTVTLQSASMQTLGSSAPVLKSSETLDVLPYSLSYAGSPVVFSGGIAVISNVATKTSASGTSNSLAVSFDGAAHFLDESSYSDTLTLSIIAK